MRRTKNALIKSKKHNGKNKGYGKYMKQQTVKH